MIFLSTNGYFVVLATDEKGIAGIVVSQNRANASCHCFVGERNKGEMPGEEMIRVLAGEFGDATGGGINDFTISFLSPDAKGNSLAYITLPVQRVRAAIRRRFTQLTETTPHLVPLTNQGELSTFCSDPNMAAILDAFFAIKPLLAI